MPQSGVCHLTAPAGTNQVRATGDGRGNGAFAVRALSAGTCLGDYEGDTLDEAAYWQRYPSGVVSLHWYFRTFCHEPCETLMTALPSCRPELTPGAASAGS